MIPPRALAAFACQTSRFPLVLCPVRAGPRPFARPSLPPELLRRRGCFAADWFSAVDLVL